MKSRGTAPITRKAAFRTDSCRACARPVLKGWLDGLFEIQLDLVPLTLAGELACMLAGVPCYSAIARFSDIPLEVGIRDTIAIQADARRPRPLVLPEHRCPGAAR